MRTTDDDHGLWRERLDFPGDAGRTPYPDREQRDADIGRTLPQHTFRDGIDIEIENIALDDRRLIAVQAHFRGQVQQAQGGRIVGDVLEEIVAGRHALVGWIDEGNLAVSSRRHQPGLGIFGQQPGRMQSRP